MLYRYAKASQEEKAGAKSGKSSGKSGPAPDENTDASTATKLWHERVAASKEAALGKGKSTPPPSEGAVLSPESEVSSTSQPVPAAVTAQPPPTAVTGQYVPPAGATVPVTYSSTPSPYQTITNCTMEISRNLESMTVHPSDKVYVKNAKSLLVGINNSVNNLYAMVELGTKQLNSQIGSQNNTIQYLQAQIQRTQNASASPTPYAGPEKRMDNPQAAVNFFMNDEFDDNAGYRMLIQMEKSLSDDHTAGATDRVIRTMRHMFRAFCMYQCETRPSDKVAIDMMELLGQAATRHRERTSLTRSVWSGSKWVCPSSYPVSDCMAGAKMSLKHDAHSEARHYTMVRAAQFPHRFQWKLDPKQQPGHQPGSQPDSSLDEHPDSAHNDSY